LRAVALYASSEKSTGHSPTRLPSAAAFALSETASTWMSGMTQMTASADRNAVLKMLKTRQGNVLWYMALPPQNTR
jgi:hypothetical protein